MIAILRLDDPDDFIVGSGSLTTIKDMLMVAFSTLDLDWQKYVDIDPTLLPHQRRGQYLLGDITKLTNMTGWKPKARFDDVIRSMIRAELLKGESV